MILIPPLILQIIPCVLFFYHWRNRNFSLVKKNKQNNQILLSVTYVNAANYLTLFVNNKRSYFLLPSSFDGKKNCFMVGRK